MRSEPGYVKPRLLSLESSLSFCTVCGSTAPNSDGQRRLPINLRSRATFPRVAGEQRPCRDAGVCAIEHLADLDENLVREWPTAKLSDLASDREQSKIDADEANTLDRRALPGGPGAELLQEGEKIGHAPMLSDLAVAHAHDVDSLELNFAAGRRHAQEFSPVGPMIGSCTSSRSRH